MNFKSKYNLGEEVFILSNQSYGPKILKLEVHTINIDCFSMNEDQLTIKYTFFDYKNDEQYIEDSVFKTQEELIKNLLDENTDS